MNDDSQILIARLLTHQTLRRDDKMVKLNDPHVFAMSIATLSLDLESGPLDE